MSASGTLWPGAAGASWGGDRPSLDPGDTIFSVVSTVTVTGTDGTYSDSSNSFAATVSFYPTTCGGTWSVTGSTQVGIRDHSGARRYVSPGGSAFLQGNSAPAAGVLTCDYPATGTQTDSMPTGASGSYSPGAGGVYAVLKYKSGAKSGQVVSGLGPVIYTGSTWSVAFPTLDLDTHYELTVVPTYGPCFTTPATIVRSFNLPAAFYRYASWTVVSTIGPSVTVPWSVVSQISRYVYPSWRIVSAIDSPTAADVTPASISASLATLHRFNYKLEVRWDRVNWVDETDRLLDASGVDDIDLQRRYLNSSELVLTLDNGDDRFSPTYRRGPLAAYLQRIGHEVRLWAGYGGNLDVLFYGMTDSLTPNMDERSLTIRALDRSAVWRQYKVTLPYTENTTADAIARTMLTGLGMVENVDFILDSCEGTIPFAMCADGNLYDELRALAEAEGGRAWFGRDGIFRLWSRSHHIRASNQPVVELDTDQHLYSIARSSSPSGMATRVTMNYASRVDLVAAGPVAYLSQPVRIPAGYAEEHDPVPHGRPVVTGGTAYPYGGTQYAFAGTVTYTVTLGPNTPPIGGTYHTMARLLLYRGGVLYGTAITYGAGTVNGPYYHTITGLEETYGEWHGVFDALNGGTVVGGAVITANTAIPETFRRYWAGDTMQVEFGTLDELNQGSFAPSRDAVWEHYVPTQVTAWAGSANRASDGSGSAVPMAAGSLSPGYVDGTYTEGITAGTWNTHGAPSGTAAWSGSLFYAAEYGLNAALVAFRNDSGSDAYITSGTVTGQPATAGGPTAVTVYDPDASAAYGDIELAIDNAYLPDASTVAERVREELFARRDPLLRLDIPLQDGLAFLHGFDIIRIRDRSVPDQEDVVDGQVLRNEWRMSEQGFTQTLILAPAVTGAYRIAAATSAALATATGTTGAIASGTWGTYSEVVMATGTPAGYWRMGESAGTVAADSSAGARNGTYLGTYTLGEPSLAAYDGNRAVRFDGTSAYVKIAPTGPTLNDTFTVFAIVSRDTASTRNDWIVSQSAGGLGLLINTADALQLQAIFVGVIASSTIAVGTGTHTVAATKSGTAVKLYVDGADVTGTVTNATCAGGANPLYWGFDPANSIYFDGILDECAVWSSALSAAQVSLLHRIATSPSRWDLAEWT